MNELAIDIFRNRLENVINVQRQSESLSNAEVVGVLELIKLDLYTEMMEPDEDDFDSN